MRKLLGGVTALSIAPVVAGCATDTPYQEMQPGRYGYADTANADGSRNIRVVLPAGGTTPDIAFAYWNRRAAEICEGRPFRKSIQAAIRPTVVIQGHGGGMPGDFMLEGVVHCEVTPETTKTASLPSS
jgi:hypothetical protein